MALVFVRFVLDDPSDLECLEGSCIASSGACISTESSMVSSLAFLAAFAAAAALRRFSLSVGLGLRSPRLRQPVLANETGTVLSAKCLPFIQTALLAAKMVFIPTTEMRTARELRLRFS